MAEPVVYSVNEVVGYKDRLCLITAITKTQAGFNRYTLEDIDSEDAFLAHKHELARAQDVIVVGAFGEELFTDQPGQVQGTVEPPAAAKQSTRFADLTEEEVDRLAEARTSKNTNIQTKWGVKIMTEWLLAKGLPVRFEELSVEDLAKQLRQFYAEVRQRNGKPYSRSGLINIRASIQSYLASPPFNKTFNIMKDREFSAANQVIQGTIKVMREAGLDTTQHKLAVQKEDMAKIRQNMNMDTPKGLQDKVFIDIVLQFARRGREGLRELTKHSFVINRDAAGRLYATPAYNEQQKNHNGQNPKVHDPRKVMYEQAGDPKCPVKALQMYLSKLHPDCEVFFQRPKSKYSRDGIWYDNVPVGKNLLSSKMSRISREAGCSEVYTNHCLRATATTVLAHAGIEHNDICAVTGHRSVDTIRQYVKEPSMDQRANMSKILHDYGSSSSTDLALCPVSTTEEAATPSTSTESTSGAVSSANSENAVVPQTLSVYSNQNSKTAVNSLLSGNNFYGTVNFYLNN